MIKIVSKRCDLVKVHTTVGKVLGTLIIGMVFGCSGAEESSPEVQDEGLGTLTGVIRLSGDRVTTPTIVENSTDPEVCGERHSLQDLVVGSGRGIRYVIVALVDVPEDSFPQMVGEPLIIDNRDCRFTPHVSVVTAGTVIEATNSDPVLHTTHLYGAMERNFALPTVGLRVSRVAEGEGMVIVKCDVHGWMQSFLRIDPHPFHAVTDAAGTFRINNIPPGEYTLEVWHERLGQTHRSIRIESAQSTEISVSFDYR